MKTLDRPVLQEFHIEGVKHISTEDALAALGKNEAVLIDVREPYEVSLESIPLDNVLYHPMSVIMEELPFISKTQNIIVGCTAGERSTKIVNLLNLQGYPNIANLDGGFNVWKAKGLPYDSSLPSNCGNGCDDCSAKIEDNTEGSCC